MRNRILSLLLATVALTVAVSSASAQFPGLRTADEVLRDAAAYRASLKGEAPMVAPDGSIVLGTRCATHGLTAAEHAAAEARTARFMSAADAMSVADILADTKAPKNKVNIVFHVVHSGGTGNVSDADIKAQVKVLTKAFKKWGFKFKLQAVTRTNNNKWFNKCHKSGVYRKMTKSLSVDPDKTLNIYSCNPGGSLLGFAYLPGSSVTGTAQDGVVVLYSTLPNGTAAPYNLGDTGTHEVGHYLGLLHTFQGGCSDGDLIDDTPAEASPAFGCPTGRDSCPGGGADPITNFMDYTDDSCMNSLTKDQSTRMKAQVAAFRPNI
jgi:hypothetical protein